MSETAALLRAPGWSALAFGIWAASIAVVPGLPVKALLAAPAVLVLLAAWTLRHPSRWISAFFAAALLLPPLPVAIGNTGPHPSLIFAGFGLLAGALGLGKWEIEPSMLNAAMMLLFAILLASVAFAAMDSGGAVAAGSLARVALFGISVYMFFYTRSGPAALVDGWPVVRRLYWIAAAAALFACIDFYFQLPAPSGYGSQFVWLDTGVYRRAQGLFYEASTLGNFCAFFLVMIAVSFSGHQKAAPVSRTGLATGGALLFAALILSYSRGSLLNLIVAVLVLIWRNRVRVRFSRLGLGLVGAGCLIWRAFPYFTSVYWQRLAATVEFFRSAPDAILSGRLASWRTLGGWIAAHPWRTVVGVGYKTLPYSDFLGNPVVADNMYVSLLVETGLLGLTALLLLHAAILRAAYRASHSDHPQKAFLGTWMLCFWAGETVQMASGDLLTYWRVLPIYFWVLALATRR